MPKRGQIKQRNNSVYVPRVSYQVAKESFFCYDNQAYPVATCDSSIFRSAVLALAPTWANDEAYNGFLAFATIDMAVRWYLIVAMAEAAKPLKLYANREEAERAVKVGV